jgi:hypothetical protein
VHSSARFIGVKRNVSDGTALLLFQVTGPGELSVHAPKLNPPKKSNASKELLRLRAQRLRLRRIEPLSIRFDRARQVRLPVRLAAAGRRLLRESGTLRVKAVVRFTPPGGPATTWKLTLTLKKKLPRRITRRGGGAPPLRGDAVRRSRSRPLP